MAALQSKGSTGVIQKLSKGNLNKSSAKVMQMLANSKIYESTQSVVERLTVGQPESTAT